ncbi:MAG TPA: hypothetical protein V6C89_15280 [Drouetiella sp.]
MSNDNPTNDQRTTSSNTFASRLLNRALNDRKKTGNKLTTADAAKFAAETEKPELVSTK